MNRWNLDKLYKGFDQSFLNDLDHLKEMYESLSQYRISDSEEALEKYILNKKEADMLYERLSCFIMLTMSADTNNSIAKKYYDQLNRMMAELVSQETLNNQWISSLDLDYMNSPLINEHLYILKEIKNNMKYVLSEDKETIIAHMRNTGSYAWTQYKDQIIASIKVTIDDQIYPLTEVLNMAYSDDSLLRKKAYEAEINAYKDYEDSIAQCLNGIKGETLYLSELRGYQDVVMESCIKSRLKRETLDTLLLVIRKNLNVLRDFLKLKANILGYSNGLPWYDMYAPIVNDTKEYSYQEGCQEVLKRFYSFSTHLGDFARKAIDEHWIDVYPREGKTGGAFCENIISIKESRFLLNYGNHFSDIITLAHELGHGFHGECLKNESILNTHYPMPIAETASTLCETIVAKEAIKDASRETAITILENSLMDATQVIVDIYSRFLFEYKVFERRKKGPLSAKELCDTMLESQKEAYSDSIDPRYFHPYMWTWKPHYYDPDYSFYNYPYAFGLLLAKGLYALYVKDHSFSKTYESFLAMTGKNDLEDVCQTLNIDLSSESFWQSSIDIIKEDFKQLKSML
ncbi:M3 family oligoendopeptidase [Eggerthia catenaformis]|uniref:M3 family oligoendopeptidase n=1 Tax=Eggerthia catenaformis TaxID=31973 RepID=UPI0028E66482|nr:M3 family oligoendopeptidase [Eggerthia catenaformis]